MTENAQRWGIAPMQRFAAPVKERVVAAIREAILDFKIKPGERLIEREIMETMDVSRATVREAISVLASEGLVTLVPQKGAHVAVLTRADAEDLYEVRALLESMLIRRFIERAQPQDFAKLRETLAPMEQAHAAGATIGEFLKAKDEFYAVLDEGAHSNSLSQMLQSIQARVRIMRFTSLSSPGRLDEVILEIQQIVDAIMARDVELASTRITEHLGNASHTALAKIPV